jgi:hypothetical protein
MEAQTKKLFSSKVSIIGLFAVLTLILTVPLVVLLSQQRQDVRGRAAESTAIPTQTPTSQGNGFISGYVYVDQNKNGERESEEKPFPDAVIKITQIKRNGDELLNKQGEAGKVVNTVSEVKTDSLGFFKFRFSNLNPDSLTYLVKLDLPSGYKTINTNPVVFSGIHKDGKEMIEFGLFPINAVAVTAAPVSTSPIPSPSRTTTQMCLQVLTPARNTTTRACNTFSNSCLPAGWIKDANCRVTPSPSKTNSLRGD